MSDVNQVLFQGGYPTPLMLARWRAKGGARGLNPTLRLTDKGRPTDAFQRAWRRSFPDRPSLPDEPLHDAEGRPTVAFIRVWSR